MNTLFSRNAYAVLPAAVGAWLAAGSAAFAQTPPAAPPAAPPAGAPAARPAPDYTNALALVGKPAPAFTLPDQNDKSVSLTDTKGKWVVLAFYPADMTTGCTFQNRSYTGKIDAFTPLNAVVYTVSTQGTESKKAFCSKEGLKHTLLSDVGGKTAGAYGVYNGRVANRVTFYIRPDGTVASVDTKIKTQTAAEDSLATLAKLQQAPPASPGTASAGSSELRGEALGTKAVTEKSDATFVGPSSIKVTLGGAIPDFALPDTATGKTAAYSTLAAGKQATAIIFVSTQCPVSNAYNERMSQLAQTYGAKGVQFVGVNANATESVDAIAAHAKQSQFGFPVLKDNDNRLADQFSARVTPEVYLVNKEGVLVYHGPIDDSQEAAGVKKRYLADAIDETLAGKPVTTNAARAFGCGIKRARR